mgnify:CR=1 FL=1|tara:strand:- start:583 stop:1071 length:489 start_codon:yes stop_codon:yes gene_type:complete
MRSDVLNANSGSVGNFSTFNQEVQSVTDSTYSVSPDQSGTIFDLNLAGGITVTLPPASAGLVYEFHIGTTFTGTLTINADSSSDTLQGMILMGTGLTLNDADDNVENWGYASPAAADHQYVADGDTKGRHLGTMLKYQAISDSKWQVTGVAICSGAIATPFT